MTERRKLMHDVRNDLNTLGLNLQCLRITQGDEAVECLDSIISASDSIVVLLDRLDRLPDDPAADATGGAAVHETPGNSQSA